jgi:hypothetical protein
VCILIYKGGTEIHKIVTQYRVRNKFLSPARVLDSLLEGVSHLTGAFTLSFHGNAELLSGHHGVLRASNSPRNEIGTLSPCSLTLHYHEVENS